MIVIFMKYLYIIQRNYLKNIYVESYIINIINSNLLEFCYEL